MMFVSIGLIWGISLYATAYFFYKKGYTNAVDDIVSMSEMIKKYTSNKESFGVDVSKRTDLN